MIDYRCGKCGEALEVPECQAGKSETCPVCKTANIVPPQPVPASGELATDAATVNADSGASDNQAVPGLNAMTQNRQRVPGAKRILFFDTETTGLPDDDEPGPDQPHVVQLAAVLADGQSEQAFTTLIRPDGWTIEDGAYAVHGISMAQAESTGIPIAEAIRQFDALLRQADLVVAHNIEFDCLMVDSEYLRLGLRAPWPRTFCTMVNTTDIVRIPFDSGGDSYKWPTLGEAYYHFFGVPHLKAHDAMADLRASQRIYYALVGGGLEKEAATCAEADEAGIVEPWADLMEQAQAAEFGLGDAVEDHDEAARLYKQAAKLGSGEACVALGILYHTEGSASGDRAAIKWFNEAVHKGAVEGYAELALLYLERRQGENAIKCLNKYIRNRDGQPVIAEFLDYMFRFLITAARNGFVIPDLGGMEQFRDQIIENQNARISQFEARRGAVSGFMRAELLYVRYMMYGSVPHMRQFGKISYWDTETQDGFITGEHGEKFYFEGYQTVESKSPRCVGLPVDFVPVPDGDHLLACVVRPGGHPNRPKLL